MNLVASESSSQSPFSTSRSWALDRSDDGARQHGPIPQVFGQAAHNRPERAPSWPMRNRSARRPQSTPSSQPGQDRAASPTPATGTYANVLVGHEGLRQDLKNIFKEGLCETLSSLSSQKLVTDEPYWVDSLRRDLQTMFRNELNEALASSSNAHVVAEEPSWAGALRRDVQTIFRNELSDMLRESPGHARLRFTGSGTAATPSLSRRTSEVKEEEEEWDARPSSNGSQAFHIRGTNHSVRLQERYSECSSRRRRSTKTGGWTPEKSRNLDILEDLRHHLADAALSTSEAISAEDIKKKFHNSKPKAYDVRDRYHADGFFQNLARQELFDNFSLVVIFLNSIWMAIDADMNDAHSLLRSEFVFVLAHVIFYTYFFVELLIRFLAFKRKTDCCKDGWFVFDSLAIIFYTLDPFVMSFVEFALGNGGDDDALGLPTEALRLLRLGRLSRLTRLLRHMPEMLIMIKGIVTAMASVGYTLGLVTLNTYVFAIAFRSIVPTGSKIEAKYFPSVPVAMHDLLIHGTFLDDLSGFILSIQRESIACLILSWLYVILSALLIMNMLIGIVCQVIATVAAKEKEQIISDRIYDLFHKLLCEFDTDEDGLLEWEEFARLLESKRAQHALKKCDVDVDALVDMVEDIFFYSYGATHGSADRITINYTTVIDLILQLRGSQVASVKDVMAIGKRLNTKLHELKQILGDLSPD